MGVGKSYLGKELAQQLGFAFADLDDEIEAKAGMSVAAIFEKMGETEFRKIEASCLRSFEDTQQIVVATGGGTPCFHENMDWMNEHGITVYFSASPAVLASRLQAEISKRPLLTGLAAGEMERFIEMKLEGRSKFYEMSHLQFNVPAHGLQGVDQLANYLSRFLR